MKLKNLLLILLSVFLFQSCESDGDPVNSDIIGSWEFDEISVNGKKYEEWPFEETVISFRENGAYSQYGLIGRESGTWTLSNKTVIVYVKGREYARFLLQDWNSSRLSFAVYELDSSDILWIKCVKFAD